MHGWMGQHMVEGMCETDQVQPRLTKLSWLCVHVSPCPRRSGARMLHEGISLFISTAASVQDKPVWPPPCMRSSIGALGSCLCWCGN